MNLGEATYLAPPVLATGAYLPSTRGSRAGMLALILGAHVIAVMAVVSLGRVVLEVIQPPLIVKLLPEPLPAKPALPPPPIPLPQLRKPEIVIPDPPRFEVLASVQLVEKPAPAPPPAPIKVPVASAPAASAEPVVEPPRFNLAYLNNPAPSYPVFAKRSREQGKVLLRVQVDAAGRVAGIEVHESSGHERLDKAALAAVRQWRFVPARQGDRAVSGVAIVPITFQLES